MTAIRNLTPGALRYSELTYDEALAAGVRVMTSAFVLANEQALTMHVFDVAADVGHAPDL